MRLQSTSLLPAVASHLTSYLSSHFHLVKKEVNYTSQNITVFLQLTVIIVSIHQDCFSAAECECSYKICEHTDEVVSQSSELHHILQVIMSEDFPAACIQATVHYFGNLFP